MPVEPAGGFHAPDLVGVLEQAESFHQPVRTDGLKALVRKQALVKIQPDQARFKTEAQATPPGKVTQAAGNVLGRVLSVDDHAIFRPQAFCRVVVAGVGAQQILPVGHEDQAAGAFVALGVVQFKAGKIITVGRVADEQRVKPLLPHELAGAFAAGGKDGCGHMAYSGSNAPQQGALHISIA